MPKKSLHWIGVDPLRHHSRLSRIVDQVNAEVDNGETLLRMVMEHQLAYHMRIKERNYQSLTLFVQSYIDNNLANAACHWWDSDLANEYSDELHDLLYPYCLKIADYVRDSLIRHVCRHVDCGADIMHVYYTGHRNSDLRDLHLKFEWSE